MLMTPERLAANQANSKLSTGPKTEAGKAASCKNSLKHGYTGAGLALPDEDAVEIETAFDRYFDQMKPRTQPGADLVHKVALCSLRLKRFGQAEAAILSQRVLDAGDAFDDAQITARNAARAKLHEDPDTQLNVLSRSVVGCEWVMEAWSALIDALMPDTFKTWRQPQFDRFSDLLGYSSEHPNYFDETMWNMASRGDEGLLGAGSDFPGDSPLARLRWARDRMIELAETELAKWEARRDAAVEPTAWARANAIIASRYDGSKEGLLAKRYEAALHRERNKALKDFKLVEAEFAEPAPIVETPFQVDVCVEVGSFGNGVDVNSIVAEPTDVHTKCLSSPITQTIQIPSSDDLEAAATLVIGFEAGESRAELSLPSPSIFGNSITDRPDTPPVRASIGVAAVLMGSRNRNPTESGATSGCGAGFWAYHKPSEFVIESVRDPEDFDRGSQRPVLTPRRRRSQAAGQPRPVGPG